MLGPLVNPSFPKNQIVGVFSLELARIYAYLFQKTDKNFSIIHSLDGYDEISLTGGVKIISNDSEKILYPEDFKLNKLEPKSIRGGRSIKESGKIFMSVLSNQGTESQKKVVVANSGLAISTSLRVSIDEGISRAKESLNSKNALKTFNTLKKLSK
jgi:anthranilate phosphoribosyltransferase